VPSEYVYSEDWCAEHNDEKRCVAHKKDGEQCLKAAIRGANVCRFHGGAAPQVVNKARERLALAADRMARELLGIAEGAASEAVKLNAIRDALDRAGVPARAEVSLDVKPWERLMGDIAGIATISREEHLAMGSKSVIDAEVVEPAREHGPVDRCDSPVGDMPRDGRGDVPPSVTPHDSARPQYMEPPSEALMTMEEAVVMDEQHQVARNRRWH
jgi:hypothetical protein